MKRFVLIMMGAMALALSIHAQDASKQATMSGWLCNTKCVTETSGHPACKQGCTDKSGEFVLIDEQGRILRIVNQDKVKSYAGKKVNMQCRPVGDGKDSMYVDTISLYGGGG